MSRRSPIDRMVHVAGSNRRAIAPEVVEEVAVAMARKVATAKALRDVQKLSEKQTDEGNGK